MIKGKISYLIENKEDNTKELRTDYPEYYEYQEEYVITKIVYFEVEDDS